MTLADGSISNASQLRNAESHLGKLKGVSEGIINVSLCRKVHNSVNLFGLQDVTD